MEGRFANLLQRQPALGGVAYSPSRWSRARRGRGMAAVLPEVGVWFLRHLPRRYGAHVVSGEPSAYRWARSRFKSAPDVGAKIINDTREKHDGFCPPRELVKAARPPSSPIHEDIYGKDDQEAAYEYRLQI